jgi:hypothetical protein
MQWNTVPSVMSASMTVPAQAMVVNIYDTETLIPDVDTPLVILLQADANPLVVRVINNDEDKFSPIRAKQAVIQFKSDSPQFQDSLTFADSIDNRWYVEITADGVYVFKGFLMLTDSQQDHFPDPNTVVLTASDHLALLKDIPLTTDAFANPIGKYRIAELIALPLKKTGLLLDIVVINNLRHGSGELTIGCTFNNPNTITGFVPDTSFFYPGQRIIISSTSANNMTTTVVSKTETTITVDDTLTTDFEPAAVFSDATSVPHFYDAIYLDAKSYEQEIGLSENCYTVLEKILGEDCFLTQWLGKWYIMRVDEYDGNPIYAATFNSDGDFISFDTPTSFSKSIGATETRRLANADALRRYDRPLGYIKESFEFVYPQEIPDNVDYSRGDVITRIVESGYTAYNLDDWDIGNLWGSAEALPTIDACILRAFNEFGDETQRFILIKKPSSATPNQYIRSSPIPVGVNDKIKFSFDVSALHDTSGDGSNLVCMIVLYGTDDTVRVLVPLNSTTFWDNTLGEIPTAWRLSNTEISLFRDGLHWSIFDDADHPDKTEWVSCEMVAPSVPVAGNIRIYLFAANQLAGTYDDFDIRYQNLSFEYRPYIGGSYQKYKGDYNKVSLGSMGYNAKREKDVFIQDSAKPLFKGSMFFISNTRLLFTGSITFAAPDSINISGYKMSSFFVNQRLVITGTNAGVYKVVSKTYHIIGNTTEILVEEAITTVTESATISEYLFALTARWYTAAPFYTAPPPASIGSPPDTTYTHPYGYIQAFSVWNQYRNANRILSTSVLGLGSMWVDALDKISLTDNNPHVNDRYFMLISFEQNWKTALWSGVFVEDYSTVIPKVYDDDHEFKYITK